MRDSFSSALAPILATQFADSMWVHQGSFTQEQIFEYGADIFVLEMVERRINTLGRILSTVRHNYIDEYGGNAMNQYNKITALYSRLSVGDEDRDGGESNSIQNQELICKG